ncbi:YheU family protein [Myxococcota bacterium]|nr:YheU family protein [Myxococcota bacterium]
MSQKQTSEAIEESATEVPFETLEPGTLRRLAEEFVTRDGTDYGLREQSLEEKVDGLMKALETGQARIYFEAESQTINIVATPDPPAR